MGDDRPVYILDSFALLAYLEKENGEGTVKAVLKEAANGDCDIFFSLINLGEVAYITEREQSLQKAQKALATIKQLPIQMVPATRQAVLDAAHIKAQHPVAYADAFAIAAALSHGGTILTGDPEFEAVEERVEIHWLEEKT